MAWHFYALYLKEDQKYNQALNCYIQANKKDPNNFNVIGDLSYMQLYLRQLNSFVLSSRKCIEVRPGNLINWVTYDFGCNLIKEYNSAITALKSTEKIDINTLKKI